MSKRDEIAVAALLSRELGLAFTARPFSLRGWGNVDDCVELGRKRYLFLEVESGGQCHPNTNVLKVWPYLDANLGVSVILAQVFLEGGRSCNGSRAKLGCWLGKQLELLLGKRFIYHRLLVSSDSCRVVEGLTELRASLGSLMR
jgi:hypothetical protein